jgi:hypothetical protein
VAEGAVKDFDAMRNSGVDGDVVILCRLRSSAGGCAYPAWGAPVASGPAAMAKLAK